MSKLLPIKGSLESPKEFSKDWDSGRRFANRGFGNLLIFGPALALSSGYTRTGLAILIVLGILTLVRGHMLPRSSQEWAEGIDEEDDNEEPVSAFWSWTPVALFMVAIVMLGGGLALFLARDDMFPVAVMSMFSGAVALFVLLRGK